MKYIIGTILVVVVVVVVGWGLTWLIQDKNRTCAHYADIVAAIGQHDPQDLRGVIDMYKDTCS